MPIETRGETERTISAEDVQPEARRKDEEIEDATSMEWANITMDEKEMKLIEPISRDAYVFCIFGSTDGE
ncbi:unnamed protein product [Nippostrongylus brasiliensis]|uniref:Retrotransposon protein n=1 Tax=Nippostrongylus brasiliensis TaxID=27835 RepID=A0A0N4XS88_NIPBR|nr:unnamed protein product [Nippostrongylus brasiliensis]